MTFSIVVPDYAAWYRLAGEFFKGLEWATSEQIEAGFKALVLSWVGIEKEPNPRETFQAVILIEMASKRLLEAL